MSSDTPARHLSRGEVPPQENHSTYSSLAAQPLPRRLIDIAHRLRPRDYVVAALLDEHTTLSTEQLAAVLFDSPITCRHRLHQLRRLHFLDRFVHRRPRAANATCWLPGVLSARFMALSRGQPPPTPKALQQRQDRVYASPVLEHLLASNQFFVDLLAHARRHPQASLARWWSARGTAAAYGQRIYPDGHGVWAVAGSETGFFLELDRGTETIGRLVDKLGPYQRLQAEGGPHYPVLFVLPGRIREQNLHRRLATRPEPGLVIATTCPESGTDPAGPVWRLAGNGRHRLSLDLLPSSHDQPGSLNPGPAQPADHPLRLLLDSRV